jgi:hypothetical protein
MKLQIKKKYIYVIIPSIFLIVMGITVWLFLSDVALTLQRYLNVDFIVTT